MPYIAEKHKIFTKAIKTTSKAHPGAQQLLLDIAHAPENASFSISGMNIIASFEGREHQIGLVKDKYAKLLFDHDYHIKSWKVTGLQYEEDGRIKKLHPYIGINFEIILE